VEGRPTEGDEFDPNDSAEGGDLGDSPNLAAPGFARREPQGSLTEREADRMGAGTEAGAAPLPWPMTCPARRP
jgi:hypothetical protein